MRLLIVTLLCCGGLAAANVDLDTVVGGDSLTFDRTVDATARRTFATAGLVRADPADPLDGPAAQHPRRFSPPFPLVETLLADLPATAAAPSPTDAAAMAAAESSIAPSLETASAAAPDPETLPDLLPATAAQNAAPPVPAAASTEARVAGWQSTDLQEPSPDVSQAVPATEPVLAPVLAPAGPPETAVTGVAAIPMSVVPDTAVLAEPTPPHAPEHRPRKAPPASAPEASKRETQRIKSRRADVAAKPATSKHTSPAAPDARGWTNGFFNLLGD